MRFEKYNRMVQRSPEGQKATDTSWARKILINYKEKIFTVKVVKHWNWGLGRLGHLSPQRCPKRDWTSPWTTWPSFEVGPALSRELGYMTFRGPIRPQLLCDPRKLDPNCWMKPEPVLHFRKELRVKIQRASGGDKINQAIPGSHSDGKIPIGAIVSAIPHWPPLYKGQGRDESCGSALLAYSKVDTLKRRF